MPDRYCKRSGRFHPYVGKVVAVCYDGKWGRAQRGEIIAVTRLHFDVAFTPWANDEAGIVALRVHRRIGRHRASCWGGWLTGHGEGGIMRWLGCRGDWYSVIPKESLEEHGYWKYDKEESTSCH